MEIVGKLIGLAIGGLICAVILRAAVKWVTKQNVAFSNAYITAFILCLIDAFLAFMFDKFTGQGNEPDAAKLFAIIMLLAVSFIVRSSVIAAMLQFSFGKACLISLAMLAIVIGIIILIGGLVFAYAEWAY